MSQILSPIQNHIISKLKNAKTLRYSELQPEKTANDLFNYHLQFLVKKGLVDKCDDGYGLSPDGVKYVADPYTFMQQPEIAHLFKVNVLTVVSRIHEGKIEILSQIRKSNPSYGKVGVMGGVVLKGESVEDAAKRKLKIETGLDADLRHIGMHRRFMYLGGELFSDIFFPIAYADSSSGSLIEDSDFGHNMWVPIDQAIKNESTEFDSITSLVTVLKAIREGSIHTLPFFYIEDTQRG